MKNRTLLLGLVFLFLSCFGANAINAQTSDQWISLGPNNVSGRSRAVIFDRFNNDIMYSGGVAGGLFISVNNGKNWQEIILGDGQQNLAITSIAQDNNGVIYLGTGEGNYKRNGFGINTDVIGMLGNGVYKSTTLNGTNKNWASSLSSDEEKYNWASQNIKFQLLDFTKPATPHNYGDGKAFVNRIAVNRQTNKVYVATDAGLMQMNDDATNWSLVNAIPATATVGDICISNSGNIAVYFKDSEGKIMVSSDDFSTNSTVLTNTNIASFDASSVAINRIRLAFGTKNTNKLYAYINYLSEVEGGYRYKETLLRTDDVNNITWRRTTPTSYSNGGDPTSMSIVIDDRTTPENVYLGGNIVRKGYDANNSDIYYWEGMSQYSNSFGSVDGVRTSPSYVSRGIHELLIKENPLSNVDSSMIVAASEGGIHIYSYDPTLYTTGWRLSTKDMITTQFYSVAVCPDASVVGGTVGNGSVYIPNTGNLGENKAGDVIWTINSPGYNPNAFQFTENGGNVGASQFQRIDPTPRKSLILSRNYGQIARTYGNNGDYYSIDDVTWNFGSTLFPTGIIENQAWAPYEPLVTPLYLWESTNSTLPDSMFLVIDKNTAVNPINRTASDEEWREGAWILPGDTVLASSPTMGYPFLYVFTDSLQFNQDTAIKIHNPIQSRLFFGTSQAMYVCSNINDYMASPLAGSLTPISMVKFYETNKFANVPTERIHCFAITDDGKTLFVTTDKVNAISDTTFLYRFDLSNIDFLNSPNAITITPEVMMFNRQITSISVDRKNGNNVILTFGTYISAQSNMQVSSNALATPFSSVVFKEVVSRDPINDEDFLPNNKPVFCALIESMNSENGNVAYIGAEDGIYKTDNFLGTPYGTKVEVNWEKMTGIPNVPVFQITQQTMNLPSYEFHTYVGQNVFPTSFTNTKLPGAIYAATHGKGLFAFLGDTIAENKNVIGIKENIITINEKPSLKAYPNPASNTTTLEYNLTQASQVTLQVYDMNSRLVSSLEKGRQSAGTHTQQINIQNLKAGIYMVRIITNNSTSTTKLIVR